MTHTDLQALHAKADRYDAIRELVCGPEPRLRLAVETAEALAGPYPPTPAQFDGLVDAVITACLTE